MITLYQQGPFYMWILFICIAAAFFLLEVLLGQFDRKIKTRFSDRNKVVIKDPPSVIFYKKQ